MPISNSALFEAVPLYIWFINRIFAGCKTTYLFVFDSKNEQYANTL